MVLKVAAWSKLFQKIKTGTFDDYLFKFNYSIKRNESVG